jgi:hypothetical protein
MRNNNEGLLICYSKTHTHVVDNVTTYPHEDVKADISGVVATPALVTTSSHSLIGRHKVVCLRCLVILHPR